MCPSLPLGELLNSIYDRKLQEMVALVGCEKLSLVDFEQMKKFQQLSFV